MPGVWDSRSGSTQVAVKTLREEHSTPEKWKGFVHEVNMMLGLAHPCIVKLIGVCLGPPLMMVGLNLAYGNNDFAYNLTPTDHSIKYQFI